MYSEKQSFWEIVYIQSFIYLFISVYYIFLEECLSYDCVLWFLSPLCHSDVNQWFLLNYFLPRSLHTFLVLGGLRQGWSWRGRDVAMASAPPAHLVMLEPQRYSSFPWLILPFITHSDTLASTHISPKTNAVWATWNYGSLRLHSIKSYFTFRNLSRKYLCSTLNQN